MPATLRVGYLGLGSNVGDRLAHLRLAVAELRRQPLELLASSSVYETEPVGLVPDQRDFLNACLRVRTELEPEQLLDACKAVERTLGRPAQGPRHGPRPIDVDLLLLGELAQRSERLELPHPEITLRRFVLVPLLELDAELTLPEHGPLTTMLAALGPGQRVRRLAPSLLPDEPSGR